MTANHVTPQKTASKRIGCLLIHGFTGTPWVFQEFKSYLEEKQVIVSDPLLPGHGTTPEDLNRTRWEQWAACAAENLEDLRSSCDCLFIAGLSMGGVIALYTAQNRPCDGVITMSAPFRFSRSMTAVVPILRLFKRSWRKNGPQEHQKEEVGYDRYPLNALTQMMRMMKTVREGMKDVRVPLLVMHSKGDRRVPVSNSRELFDAAASERKRILLLGHPCHVVTKGLDQELVLNSAWEFIRENA
ncbi:MAG: alpha/beta fold hydrolase [bacterium]|nr:alpha/beta fold hydrolase [bacterium]